MKILVTPAGGESIEVVIFCDCKDKMFLISTFRNTANFKCFECNEVERIYIEGDLERGLK